MPSLAASTLYAFGITALGAGIHNLFSPQSTLQSFQLPLVALPAANGNSLAAISMGSYYILSAYQENRAAFQISVPTRALSATIFWYAGGLWSVAGVWEGIGALSTALALGWEMYQERRKFQAKCQ